MFGFKFLYLSGLFPKSFFNNFLFYKGLLKKIKLNNLSFNRSAMDLASVIQIFETMIPPKLAEDWDNTGLLIEPSDKKLVTTILFTNDLTENVLKEALTLNTNLIISYHPPIFVPMKSLRMSSWKHRIVMECVKNSIAVYSPHTACDAVKNGVNDWLINAFDLLHFQPIKQSLEIQPKYSYKIEFSSSITGKICNDLNHFANIDIRITGSSNNLEHVQVLVDKSSLTNVLQALTSQDISSLSVSNITPLPMPSCGMGRIGKLQNPIKLKDCIEVVKNHLQLSSIRLAMGNYHSLDSEISTVAVCAGSGSSILKDVEADLYITGEMSHHDLLDITHRNISVILSEHSNSERGYLLKLIDSLNPKLPGIKLITSSVDRDPISIV